jgi:hypothetical protein
MEASRQDNRTDYKNTRSVRCRRQTKFYSRPIDRLSQKKYAYSSAGFRKKYASFIAWSTPGNWKPIENFEKTTKGGTDFDSIFPELMLQNLLDSNPFG